MKTLYCEFLTYNIFFYVKDKIVTHTCTHTHTWLLLKSSMYTLTVNLISLPLSTIHPCTHTYYVTHATTPLHTHTLAHIHSHTYTLVSVTVSCSDFSTSECFVTISWRLFCYFNPVFHRDCEKSSGCEFQRGHSGKRDCNRSCEWCCVWGCQ